jgi:hypothetical protein
MSVIAIIRDILLLTLSQFSKHVALRAVDPNLDNGPRLTVERFPALMLLFSLVFLTGCGGGSGNGSSTPPPQNNPVPAVVSLNPNSADVGAPAFTLIVDGLNFASGAAIQWNGRSITTAYVNSSELQAQITAADVASAGTATVSVINPAPGGGNSGQAEFTINPDSNVAPSLSSLSPVSVNAGSSGFLLTVSGANFVPAATIQWNGAPISTTYLSATQLEAQIPAADVANPGFAAVTVLNPAPGGGLSGSLVFGVNPLPTVVSQLANDLVWDATHQLIYLSVPSLASSHGNSVVALDPETGAIQSSQFAGSEPDRLAISDDDQYLYVGLDGSSSVLRLSLPSLAPDITSSLGAFSIDGPTFAVELQVAPGLPHTTAVSRGDFNVSPYALGGLVIYDDATPRSTVANASGPLYDSLQWGSDTSIFANNSEVATFDLYALTVSGSGVVQSADYPNVFPGFGTAIHYDSGTNLIYGDDGSIANPATGQQVASFNASGLMIPDSTLNTAFFLGQTEEQVGTQNLSIESFNLTTFAPVAEIVVPNVQGNPLHFIRWAANGLAFNDDAGFVYILANPFVASNAAHVVIQTNHEMPVRNTRFARRVPFVSKAVPFSGSKRKRTAESRSADAISNPSPSISALSPNSVSVGVAAFTLTVMGSSFVSLSTIEWNGAPLPTELVSSSELQAQITASDAVIAGAIPVTVMTPGPGGGTSNSLSFTVVAPTTSDVPSILSLLPDGVAAGGSGFTLSVNGGNFIASSVVQWNGSSRPTELNGAQLEAQINASDIATPGYAQITVSNAGPGGGTSNPAPFQVLYQPTIVNQVTNDMVWDPLNHVIYISIPGSASAHANQICVLNPMSGAIVNCQAAGSEPDVMAISSDSQFLYVGEDGAGSVQRFTLPALTLDINYSLGNDQNGTPYYALDLQVAPGAPHTTAVSKGILNVDPAAEGGVTIYDDATARSASALGWAFPGGKTYDSLQWGTDATVLYAADTENETNGLDFYTLTVNSSGVALNEDYPSVFWNAGRIHFDMGSGLVYSDDGFHAVDPSTGLPAGIFEVGAGDPMAPDSNLNTVFIFSQYAWQESSNYTIDLFDITHYVPVTQIPISTTQGGLNRLGRFIRWGTNGLAFNDTAGNIYLVSGPFVTTNATSQSKIRSPNRTP